MLYVFGAYAMNPKIENLVKEFRTSAGMTQQDLADVVGVSRQSVISIERGRYVPSLALALKMAAVFACSSVTSRERSHFARVQTTGPLQRAWWNTH